MKFWVRGFSFLCSVLIFASFVSQKVYAVSVSITSYPATIMQDMFTITASISGAGNGTNYLRIDLYKDGSQNYFGETFNGTDWYSGSDYHQYFPITIVNASWSGSLQGNLGSPTLSEYDGTGTYRMRLRRYTSGGSTTSSEADASSVSIAIVTPSPIPTAIPTPTSTPTTIPLTNTPFPTARPQPTNTPTMLVSPTALLSFAASTTAVLGIQVSPYPTLVKGIAEEKNFNWVGFLSILVGIALFVVCGILMYREWKKQSGNTNTKL